MQHFFFWTVPIGFQVTRWLSWYGVGLASADRLPVVVRIPAGPLGSLKCDPPKGNGRRPQKGANWLSPGHHTLRLTCGPAGNRTATGSRTSPYQLLHRDAFQSKMQHAFQSKHSHSTPGTSIHFHITPLIGITPKWLSLKATEKAEYLSCFTFLFHRFFVSHHSRCDPALSVFASKCQGVMSCLYFFCVFLVGARCFGGSHLRLPSGPAGIRTITGSLSALARPTPYQLSHRVACVMSCLYGCSLWSRGSWLGGSLVSAWSFVASLTHQHGPLVCFVVPLFCFLFWAILNDT